MLTSRISSDRRPPQPAHFRSPLRPVHLQPAQSARHVHRTRCSPPCRPPPVPVPRRLSRANAKNAIMIPNPHKLGVHKLLKHIPLNGLFDAPSKARLRKAVNIADLRLCAKQRAHKVSLSMLRASCSFQLYLVIGYLTRQFATHDRWSSTTSTPVPTTRSPSAAGRTRTLSSKCTSTSFLG